MNSDARRGYRPRRASVFSASMDASRACGRMPPATRRQLPSSAPRHTALPRRCKPRAIGVAEPWHAACSPPLQTPCRERGGPVAWSSATGMPPAIVRSITLITLRCPGDRPAAAWGYTIAGRRNSIYQGPSTATPT